MSIDSQLISNPFPKFCTFYGCHEACELENMPEEIWFSRKLISVLSVQEEGASMLV